MTLTTDEVVRLCRPLPDGGLTGPDGGPLPLQEVRLEGTVTGLTAALTLTQVFRNDRSGPIEAVYTFPLPDRFAVAGLTALLGDREVVGEISERDRARAEYSRALATGHRAALVEQERSEVFTAQLGNIAPGEQAVITLSLAGRLGIDDGQATLRVPLVVGERYVPGAPLGEPPSGTGTSPDTTAVPDASRITPPRVTGRTGVALEVAVRVRAEGLLTGTARTAAGTVATPVEEGWLITADPGTDLDRDLVARFPLAAGPASARVFLSRDADDAQAGTWQLVLAPDTTSGPPAPRSVAVILDRSGSMGRSMVLARRAAARIVDSLGSGDHFLTIGFDNAIVTPPGLPGLAEATDANRFATVGWLAGLQARGGTNMASALMAGADALADAPGERVLILVTDGQVGNEAQILSMLAERLNGVRIHTLGTSVTVNAAFLRRLAELGHGRCDLVDSDDALAQVLAELPRRIAPPQAWGLGVAATGVRIDRSATTPQLADLFPSGPAFLTGRWAGDPAEVGFTALAETADGIREWEATVSWVQDPVDALRNGWARERIEDLQARADLGHRAHLTPQIVELSLAHRVLSRHTAWLAVGPGDVEGDLRTVVQPVAATQDAMAPTWLGYASPTAPAPRSRAVPTDSWAGPDYSAPSSADSSYGSLPGPWGAPYPAPPSRGAADYAQPAAMMPARRSVPWGGPAPAGPGSLWYGDKKSLRRLNRRLKHLLARCARSQRRTWNQRKLEQLQGQVIKLVRDLEAMGAPRNLVDAVRALPGSHEVVAQKWAVITATAG